MFLADLMVISLNGLVGVLAGALVPGALTLGRGAVEALRQSPQ